MHKTLILAEKRYKVDEKLLNAVTGASGSSPAFALMLIESIADGALLCGLPKSIGVPLAAKAVLGAAKMVLESGDAPAVIRDRVTSPGGTTIAGVKTLEDEGFRGAVISAVESVVQRAEEIAELSEEDSD